MANKAYNKLFGANYSKRESTYVLIAGGLMAFNSGYVNGSCLSGFLVPSGETQSVAGFTSAYTRSGLALSQGDFSAFGYHSNIILSYMLGDLMSGVITPDAIPYRIEPTYGPTFLIGGIFLLMSSILAALEWNPNYIWFFAATADGIQNGIASIYSANLIRCSLTGSSTDIALVVGQLLRGQHKNLWKGMVLTMIVVSFWTGGIIAFYATSIFRVYSLFVNAALFWLVGASLIIFLVKELNITFRAALFGTWHWRQNIQKLHKRMRLSMHGGGGADFDSAEHHKDFRRLGISRIWQTV